MKTIKITYLQYGLRQLGGRSSGLITISRRGSLVKQKYRFLDTKRCMFPTMAATILNPYIYDVKRSSKISLIIFPNGIVTYILASQFAPNQTKIYNLYKSPQIHDKGWSNFLYNFPIGSIIHNIEIIPGLGAKIAKAAGTHALILRKTQKLITVKLKSGAHHLINSKAIAVSGYTSNYHHFLRNYKKAGIIRLLGIRPRSRPSAMNPVDHPMGGRTKGGIQPQSKKKLKAHTKTSKSTRHPLSARISRLNKKKKKIIH